MGQKEGMPTILVYKTSSCNKVDEVSMWPGKMLPKLKCYFRSSFFTRECNETSIAGGQKALAHSIGHSIL